MRGATRAEVQRWPPGVKGIGASRAALFLTRAPSRPRPPSSTPPARGKKKLKQKSPPPARVPRVVGCPRTVDGNLQCAPTAPVSFGLDTACRTFSELAAWGGLFEGRQGEAVRSGRPGHLWATRDSAGII